VLSVWASNGNDRKTIGQYPLTVAPDLSAVDAPVQSHAAKMLAQIEAVLEFRMTGRKSGPLESYTIDGRSMQDFPTDELYTLRAQYASEVAAEQNPTNQIGQIKFSFPPACPPSGLWPLGDPRMFYR